jgi:hypothetical protein
MKAVRNFLGWPLMFIGLFATIVGQAREEVLFSIVGAGFLFAGLLAVVSLRKRCFSCHKTNNDKAIFCRHCGTHIEATFYRDSVEEFVLDLRLLPRKKDYKNVAPGITNWDELWLGELEIKTAGDDKLS